MSNANSNNRARLEREARRLLRAAAQHAEAEGGAGTALVPGSVVRFRGVGWSEAYTDRLYRAAERLGWIRDIGFPVLTIEGYREF